jgi:hypothetical protein
MDKSKERGVDKWEPKITEETLAQDTKCDYYNLKLKTMKFFRTWTFRWWEIGIIKLCLLSLGILLGLYFYDYLLGLVWLWWGLFAITSIYFIARFIKEV